MMWKKALIAVGCLLGVLSMPTSALACGDYCDWGGLYSTTGYLGYDLGTTLYDISSYTVATTVQIDTGYSGGCGSFSGGCGSYTPSVCGSDYSSGYFDPVTLGSFLGMGSTPFGMNPYSMTSPVADPTMNPYMNPYAMPYGNPYLAPSNPILSMMAPQMFPPGMTNPYSYMGYPGSFPAMPNISLLPYVNPYTPYTGTGYTPTTPVTNPYAPPSTNYGTVVPPTTIPPSTTPVISTPPTTTLPWGGCDNVVVMCPSVGPVAQPTLPPTTTTPTIPVSPSIVGQPTYQTVPTDPTRYQIPRGTSTH